MSNWQFHNRERASWPSERFLSEPKHNRKSKVWCVDESNADVLHFLYRRSCHQFHLHNWLTERREHIIVADGSNCLLLIPVQIKWIYCIHLPIFCHTITSSINEYHTLWRAVERPTIIFELYLSQTKLCTQFFGVNTPADQPINWNRITLFNSTYHTFPFVFSILCVTCGRVQNCVVR